MDKAKSEILFKLINSLQALEMAESKLDLAIYSSVRYVSTEEIRHASEELRVLRYYHKLIRRKIEEIS